jgi:hypothetical protein
MADEEEKKEGGDKKEEMKGRLDKCGMVTARFQKQSPLVARLSLMRLPNALCTKNEGRRTVH